MNYFPLQKTFIKKYFNEDGRFLFEFRYKQVTLQEYFEFFDLSEKEREIFLIQKIIDQLPYRWYERMLKKIFPNFLPKRFLVLDFEKIATKMMSEIFMTQKSLFENVKNEGKNGESAPFSAILTLICEKYNISVVDVVNNLTLEQFFWLQDGVMYSLNAQTEEGQKTNNYAMNRNKKSSTNWEEIKRRFEKSGL